jgi:YHS domain-containing protein
MNQTTLVSLLAIFGLGIGCAAPTPPSAAQSASPGAEAPSPPKALAPAAAAEPAAAKPGSRDESAAAGPPGAMKRSATGTPESTTAAGVKAPGEATIGDKTSCPVMKDDVFVVTADSPKFEYKNKTYYFCCKGCVDKFKAAPQQYVANP